VPLGGFWVARPSRPATAQPFSTPAQAFVSVSSDPKFEQTSEAAVRFYLDLMGKIVSRETVFSRGMLVATSRIHQPQN